MRSSNDEHPTLKADLMGRRLVWISETEENGSLRMEQLKSLTGGDSIKARFMRADYFSFEPTHTLVVATNHRPYVNSTEFAAWRRLRLVTFPFTFHADSEPARGLRPKESNLRDRLKKGSAQREAMLAWLVAGAVAWHTNGLGESPAVVAATQGWRNSEDVVLRFIDDCLLIGDKALRDGDEARTDGSSLYESFRQWCSSEGRPASSNKNFSQMFLNHEAVKDAGVTVVRPQGKAFYKRVKLTSSNNI